MIVEFKTGDILAQERHVAFPMCTVGHHLNGVAYRITDRWPDMVRLSSSLGDLHTRRVSKAKTFHGLVCYNHGHNGWANAAKSMTLALSSLELPEDTVIGVQLPIAASRVMCSGLNLQAVKAALLVSERRVHVYGA